MMQEKPELINYLKLIAISTDNKMPLFTLIKALSCYRNFNPHFEGVIVIVSLDTAVPEQSL